jgi:hypothetical protein
MSKDKTINVFFDTEFTTIHPLEVANLISIGCVAQDGKEIYFELLDTWAIHQCSAFVLYNVLELLDNKVYHKEEDVAHKLSEWVENLGGNTVIFRSDSPSFDWRFVADMFNKFDCWPTNLERKCGVIAFENHNIWHRYQAGMADFWKSNNERQHHALVDARSLKFAWGYAHRRRF